MLHLCIHDVSILITYAYLTHACYSTVVHLERERKREREGERGNDDFVNTCSNEIDHKHGSDDLTRIRFQITMM